jgi:hypothetical protein
MPIGTALSEYFPPDFQVTKVIFKLLCTSDHFDWIDFESKESFTVLLSDYMVYSGHIYSYHDLKNFESEKNSGLNHQDTLVETACRLCCGSGMAWG